MVSCDEVWHLFACVMDQTRVEPVRDVIYVNGNRLPKKLPPKVYFALNKPKGFVINVYLCNLSLVFETSAFESCTFSIS